MPEADIATAIGRQDVAPAPPLDSPPTVGLRSQRLAGLLLVLAAAFLTSVINSLVRVFGFDTSYPDALVKVTYAEGIVRQLLSLALLFYVVRQNRGTLADLGLKFRNADLIHGFGLWVVTTLLYRAAYPFIASLSELLGWHRAAPYVPSQKLGLGIITFCFVIVNPVFEEMIVRAFLMTETIALGGSAALAVVVSTALQTSYHLYQGLPSALSVGIVFLIFSLYYAGTRRITTVIFAHFLADLSAHVLYALHHVKAHP